MELNVKEFLDTVEERLNEPIALEIEGILAEMQASQLETLVRQESEVQQTVLLAEIKLLIKEQEAIANLSKARDYHPYTQGKEFGQLHGYKKILGLIESKQSA